MRQLGTFLRRNGHYVLLALIVLLGLFFRFYKLNSLPPGLHPDEAANGLDIFRMFDHHDFRVLYNTNGPREALFFYLQAIFVGLMGNTILALRMAPALLGSIAVPVMYLWGRSWFGKRVGLMAAFIMAITPWAITITRDGFRASMMELLVPLTLWLFTRALQTGKRLWYILAGVSLGAGMYTYLSWRLFPFVLIAVAGFIFIFHRDLVKAYMRPLIISIVTAAIVFIPMGIFAVVHPDDFGARASGTSFLNKDLNHGHPVQTLTDNVVKTALMFNFHGDENYRHNLGGQPEFNIFIGVMFVLGLLLSLVQLGRPKYFALLATFGVMLLPEVLTAEGIPHALRSIGALAPAVLLSALGIDYLIKRWNDVFPINSAARVAGSAAVIVLLLLSAYQGYTQYFVAWANAPETARAYSADTVAIANYINGDQFKGPKYALVDGYSDKTVYYITHYHSTYTRMDPRDIDAIPEDKQVKEFIIAEGFKAESLKKLHIKYPKGKLAPHFSANGDTELFTVYTTSQ